MIYRKALISDLNQLSELFNDYRIFYRKESDIDAAKSFLADRILNKESKIYIAEQEDRSIVGFVQLYPMYSSTRMKKIWLLNDLFVHPDHRSKGIAIGLIEKSKKLAQKTNACGLLLETEKSNIIGNKLYPKTGFKLNTISNFYEWNE